MVKEIVLHKDSKQSLIIRAATSCAELTGCGEEWLIDIITEEVRASFIDGKFQRVEQKGLDLSSKLDDTQIIKAA